MEKKTTNKKFRLIFIILLAFGLIYGGYKYIHSLSHETTDDAQVSKKMNPIIPRVSGYITKVFVKDNDIVKKGDTLFVIDKSDYVVKVEEAKANLVAAENSFEVVRWMARHWLRRTPPASSQHTWKSGCFHPVRL